MDLEGMAVDELDAESVRLKGEVETLRDQRRAIKAVRDRKVTLESLAAKLGVPVDGLTPEQADNLLAIARTPKPGDVVLTPGTGHLPLSPNQPAVGGSE